MTQRWCDPFRLLAVYKEPNAVHYTGTKLNMAKPLLVYEAWLKHRAFLILLSVTQLSEALGELLNTPFVLRKVNKRGHIHSIILLNYRFMNSLHELKSNWCQLSALTLSALGELHHGGSQHPNKLDYGRKLLQIHILLLLFKYKLGEDLQRRL